MIYVDLTYHLTSAANDWACERHFVRFSLTDIASVRLLTCSSILSGTRTARFYTNLVETGQAVSASAVSAYPADKCAAQQ